MSRGGGAGSGRGRRGSRWHAWRIIRRLTTAAGPVRCAIRVALLASSTISFVVSAPAAAQTTPPSVGPAAEPIAEAPAGAQPVDPRLAVDTVIIPPLPDSVIAGASFIEQDSVRVVYWGESERHARRTLEAALVPIPLPGITGDALLPRATIYLPPDRATYDALTFGGAPEWAAAVAIPASLSIVIPPGRTTVGGDDPVVTLRHEIAHLALNRHLGARVPRWFDEGYATWVSGGWDESTGWMIRLALVRGTDEPLDSLTLGWPRGESRARLAYLLSASAVRHLATSRGDEAFAAFMAEWKAEGSMEPAMRSVYFMTLSQFEREWRAMVKRRYGWLLAFSQVGAFWVAVVLTVFLLGTLRRRRNREKLAEMRREEYMLPASIDETYDEVDPDLPRV